MGWEWRTIRIVLALTVGCLLCLEDGRPAFARSAKEKKTEKRAAPESVVPLDRGTTPQSSKRRSEQPIKAGARPQFTKEAEPTKSPVQRGHKTRRQGPRKLPPKAIILPKPNLSYMGKFEQPQRYDPSRDYRKGGPPNPQAGDVLHDHFQELDRNHDGVIDPLERASSRLDIDRDLSNRQWP